jgi:YHS domain-containing protein
MIRILVVFGIVFSIAYCGLREGNGNIGHAPAPELENKKLDVASLSSNIDPVCEMTLDNSILADTAIVDGKTYGFCNEGCKVEFLNKRK